MKSFVDQLKRVVIAKGLCTADNKCESIAITTVLTGCACVCVCLTQVEEVCAGMLKELKEEVISGSGPYMEFLEAMEEEDKLVSSPALRPTNTLSVCLSVCLSLSLYPSQTATSPNGC